MDGRMRDQLRRCEAFVPQIDDCAGRVRGVRDVELREAAAAVRKAADSETMLPEAFGVVSEACRRVTGELPVAEQLIGGAALHLGLVADVQGGEGRRIMTLLAAALDAFAGQAVHVVSVSDHLARREAEWARRVGEFVGLSVGLVTPDIELPERRDAYRADVTYGSASEFAYDHLRDNLSWDTGDIVQRGHDRAYLDDIDTLLVDDGRAEYRITAPAAEDRSWPEEAARLARAMRPGRHYDMHPQTKVISLTDAGTRLIEDHLGGEDIIAHDVIYEVRTALRAKDDYARGKQYDVVDGGIVVIDRETGTATGRTFGSRILRALEAKERLPVSETRQTLSRTTARGYFRLYRQLAGSSCSAERAADALARLYDLDTLVVPTHRPLAREEHDDRLFRTTDRMYDAVVADVLDRHESGQPVIVAAATARGADQLLGRLTEAGITCRSADGAHPENDAAATAAAARTGAVTIVTEPGCRGSETVLDGVAVLGVGRHRSRRHDDRLRGLAGRNGAAGECAFFISWEDLAEWGGGDSDLAPDADTLFPEEATEISPPGLTEAVELSQQEYEATMARVRELVGAYEDVWDDQCREFFALRRALVGGGTSGAGFVDLLHRVADGLTPDDGLASLGRWGLDGVLATIGEVYPTTLTRRRLRRAVGKATVRAEVHADADHAYERRCAQIARESGLGPEIIPGLQWRVLLAAHDQLWRQHVDNMELLHEDVGARVLADDDRMSEFRLEADDLFRRMKQGVEREAVAMFFRVTVG